MKKIQLYSRLALNGIRNNKKLYSPFILSGIVLIVAFYCLAFLAHSPIIEGLYGAELIKPVLLLGLWVILFFSFLFIFYTNLFLMKRRQKDYGLYSVLGMNKLNLSGILFLEFLYISIFTIGLGIICGILLAKLAELGLLNITKNAINFNLTVNFTDILITVIYFLVIFLLIFLYSALSLTIKNPVELMTESKKGERPIKANYLLGIVGLLLLLGAYYVGSTVTDPIETLGIFFQAVIVVIIGTYLFLIFTSVALCKLLQKNKKFYYKPNHFVSISSMANRMKRNGAGLASICILITIVLVIISTTVCLIVGENQMLFSRYPREFNINCNLSTIEAFDENNITSIESELQTVIKNEDITPQDSYNLRKAFIYGYMSNDHYFMDYEDTIDQSNLKQASLIIIPLSDYNKYLGTNYVLTNNEAFIMGTQENYPYSTIQIGKGKTFQIVSEIDNVPAIGETAMVTSNSLILIIPDYINNLTQITSELNPENNRFNYSYLYSFNCSNLSPEKQIELGNQLEKTLNLNVALSQHQVLETVVETQEENQYFYTSLYGGIFFLGIILSFVFIIATVVIMYYKQVTEGYEDAHNFEIMQNVGMTEGEIKRSINFQILLIFFIPLILAVIHLIFAYPFIIQILNLFELNNAPLFITTTCITVLVFSLFYLIIYGITSRTYYTILIERK